MRLCLIAARNPGGAGRGSKPSRREGRPFDHPFIQSSPWLIRVKKDLIQIGAMDGCLGQLEGHLHAFSLFS